MADVIVILSDDDDEENGASNSNSKIAKAVGRRNSKGPNGQHLQVANPNTFSIKIENDAMTCFDNKTEDVQESITVPNGVHLQMDVSPTCPTETVLTCFDDFITLCRKQTNDPDLEKIIPKLRKRYCQANKDYTQSKKFLDFVQSLQTRLQDDPKCVFVHVKELSDELTAYKVHSNSRGAANKLRNTKSNKLLNGIPVEEVKTISSDGDISLPSTSTGVATVSTLVDSSGVGSKKTEVAIGKYEKLLAHLSKKIQKLREKELSIDDMDDEESTYILEDRLQKRFMEVWSKICKLKGRVLSTGRATERTFNYQGSRYPEINRKINRHLNKFKHFPDFSDVLELVERVVSSHHLPMKSVQAHTEAQTVFTDVGKMLRSSRLAEFDELLYSGDPEEDPAEKDEELARRLDESATKGKAKIEEVLNTFAEKQLEMEKSRKKGEKDIGNENERPATPDDLRDDGEDDLDDSGESGEEADDKLSEDGHLQELMEELKDEVANDELDATEANVISEEESYSEEEAVDDDNEEDEDEKSSEQTTVIPVACHAVGVNFGDPDEAVGTILSTPRNILTIEVPSSEDAVTIMAKYREHSDNAANLNIEQMKNCSPVSVKKVQTSTVYNFGGCSVKRELEYPPDGDGVAFTSKRLRTDGHLVPVVIADDDVITISDSD